MTYDKQLFSDRVREAWNRRLIGVELHKKAMQKSVTRQQIIEVYEALYVDTAESLANTEDAFKEEEGNALRQERRADRLERELEEANREWSRYEMRCEALLKLVTIAVAMRDPENTL